MTVPTRDRPHPAAIRGSWPARVLRSLAVLGLAVDVLVHLRLAPVYDQLGTAVTQGALFRLEAGLAAAAAVYLALRDNRRAWLYAGAVAAAGTVAVLVTRYVDVPALGPFPDMYDPSWSTDKLLVTAAMVTTLVAWACREALRSRSGRPWAVAARRQR